MRLTCYFSSAPWLQVVKVTFGATFVNGDGRFIVSTNKVAGARGKGAPIRRFLTGPVSDRVTLYARRSLVFPIGNLMGNFCRYNDFANSKQAISCDGVFNVRRFVCYFLLHVIWPKRANRTRARDFHLLITVGGLAWLYRAVPFYLRSLSRHFRRRPMANFVGVGLCSRLSLNYLCTRRYVYQKRGSCRSIFIRMISDYHGVRVVWLT